MLGVPRPDPAQLLTSLIYLLDNNELPLNRAGAAGWIYDEKLWLGACPRTINAYVVK